MGRKSRTNRQQQSIATRQQQTTSAKEREADLEARRVGQGTLFSETLVEQSLHMGPLPAPETFDHYERVLPGSAERIIKMAEQQGNHRRRIESWVVIAGGVIQGYLGTLVGGAISTLTIWWSVGLIRDGFGLIGLAPTIGALASLVGVFIYSRKQQDKELAEKRKK